MSLNSVQQAVKDTLTGLQIPNYRTALDVMIRPLVPDNVKLEGPKAYIWGSEGRISRVAIPRGEQLPTSVPPVLKPGTAGWKNVDPFTIRIWLIATDQNNDPNGDSRFPVLIQKVIDTLQAVQVPIYLTDSVTTAKSWLMNLGETIVWDYDVDRTLGEQRLLRSVAVVTCSVMEIQQA